MSHKREWLFRLQDILSAVQAIQDYTAGMSFEDFVADRKTVDAVVRNYIIIGEAAAHVPDRIVQENQSVPWEDMRAMRNFVVHEYFGVSDKILWDTAKLDLDPIPELLRVVILDNNS